LSNTVSWREDGPSRLNKRTDWGVRGGPSGVAVSSWGSLLRGRARFLRAYDIERNRNTGITNGANKVATANVAVPGQACEHGTFVPDIDIERVGQRNVAFLACIGGAAKDREVDQILRGDPQAFEHGRFEIALRMVERELEFGQAQHGKGPAGGRAPRAPTDPTFAALLPR